jgi:2-polyprenyl-3-methyl-5-hydroxy-6-metoxy-1,4-benzoquinol methylase
MNEFDTWRKNYDSMTIQQQIEYHNELEAKYPEQAHFNYENVKILLDMSKKNPSVLEFGIWKADLCEIALKDYQIKSWTGIEICESAIQKTKCKSPKLKYIMPDKFDWFKHDERPKCDVVIATHFIEHLSDEHFVDLANYCKGVPLIYFEAPLSENGQNWNGYFGTHKLNLGWSQVIQIMANNGFEVVHHLNQGKIFKTI